jgi:uncharacterized phage protein (TIGR02218 family)
MKLNHAALQAHKAQSSTTLTDLLLVDPDGLRMGFTLLDVDVTYDDGNGNVVYKARTGVEMSALVSTSDLGVDNAEATTLAPVAGFLSEGITQQQVDSGALDKAPFVVYRVNYADLSMGHEIVGGGTIGEQRTKFSQFTVLELRSLSQQLKQSVGELDSLTCRAKFGSQVGDERFPCGFDLATEWVDSLAVTSVGAETDREFTCVALDQADNYFAPGVVEWLAGDNAGQSCEVESFAGGVVTLQFPTVNPILASHEFRIRRDCSKRKTGHNSCKDTFWLTDWALHFRGEPAIPVSRAGKLLTPGAGLSTNGTSGTGE